MPACSVCQHPSAGVINKALAVGGEAKAVLARRHGLSRQALLRHLEHLPEQVTDARDAGLLTPNAPIMDELVEMKHTVQNLIRMMQKGGDLRGATSAIKEARGVIELIGRIQGDLTPPPPVQVNVIQSIEFQTVAAKIINALVDHPEARLRVTAALEDVGR